MNMNVKFKGATKPIQVTADTYEKDDEKGELVLKDSGGKVIASFHTNELAGWWVEPSHVMSDSEREASRRVIEKLKDPK
jgi:hypothetical protein